MKKMANPVKPLEWVGRILFNKKGFPCIVSNFPVSIFELKLHKMVPKAAQC